jgi:hypothetical protein
LITPFVAVPLQIAQGALVRLPHARHHLAQLGHQDVRG